MSRNRLWYHYLVDVLESPSPCGGALLPLSLAEIQIQCPSQETCNIWHLEAEASPNWIKKEIEKEHWTAGKLHCPYCRTRLGAFNFVHSTKCSCGRLAVIRLCKSKIDVDVAVKTPCQASSASKISTHFDKKFKKGMAEHHKRNWIMDRYVAGTLVDALCLEVPKHDKYFEPSGERPCITFNVKNYNSVLQERKANCNRNVLHRKSYSLDWESTEKLPLKPHINMKWASTVKQRSYVPLLSSAAAGSNKTNRHMFEAPPRTVKLSARETFNLRDDPGVSRLEKSTDPSSSEVPITPVRITPGGESIMTPEVPTQIMQPTLPNSTFVNQRLNKREINRLKNLRRKQKKRDKWLLGQKQINTSHHIVTEEDDELIKEKESYTCAVCLDVYFNPYLCYPCRHIFCEPCLRTLARDNPTRTPCPLCRSIITRVHFHSDLSKCSAAFFPNEYLKRKQSFQRASCAKWPLPYCNRLFRVFGDFRRHMGPIGRRQFPHGEHRLDFEDDSHGWRFDLDMIIIYIYSVNWVIGFILFCLLCYFFFLSL
ncbi:E3 ubiquitin-protein ligase RNF180 isoform X2 [Bufo gargarizans]|uniref:E3 ubiquitin-protein ligase RNF180 isoform X2 n=1 Tax=Bufo gargarizans TaxID=30331 RepID=UPI001CF43EDE|nr:E3 ubiquitin-protein ligase RNF180 isoform X2 [Bufo gargarizans]